MKLNFFYKFELLNKFYSIFKWNLSILLNLSYVFFLSIVIHNYHPPSTSWHEFRIAMVKGWRIWLSLCNAIINEKLGEINCEKSICRFHKKSSLGKFLICYQCKTMNSLYIINLFSQFFIL